MSQQPLKPEDFNQRNPYETKEYNALHYPSSSNYAFNKKYSNLLKNDNVLELIFKISSDAVIRQAENIFFDVNSINNAEKSDANDNDQPSNQQINSPSQLKSSGDCPSEEQEKSENVDQNKSEEDYDDEDESNIKSDDKEDEGEDRSGEDVKKEEPSGKKCFNKLCFSKKIYKKLRSKVERAKYRFLCRPCYQNYLNNDFCEFCEQIYSSTGNADDDDQWIGCDQCNRWNHIECEKKYRNKSIHETKDHDVPYLCLTCTQKVKKQLTNDKKTKNAKDSLTPVDDGKLIKQKLEIAREQRIQIFNRKLQYLPSLDYFLQNYNFRLWINENLIKDDLEALREASKRNIEEGKKGLKKVKVD